MRELIAGPLADLIGVVLYVAVAGALTVVGAMAERAGFQDLTAGQTTLGLWEAAFGAILIYAGLSVAYHILLPRLRGSAAVA